MTHVMDQALDRRVRRTREAIFQAFASLAMSRRYDGIRTADIIEAANIGRSTFYEHFKGKDDILLEAVVHVFTPIADAATGRADRERLRFVLEHFWEQRAFGRALFDSHLSVRLQRKLAGLIAERLADSPPAAVPRPIIAAAAAAAQLGMIRVWLRGEAPCPAGVLADEMTARSRALTGV
jgi:AcrR family transcriptional regulator